MTTRAQTETGSPEATQALGTAIGEAAHAGDVLLLLGPFGAGKTTLVRGIARGLGVDGPITSPSFVIANEHPGRIPLYHLDLYRLERMDQATLEALDEYFQSDGICAVEWPNALPTELAEHATRIELALIDETTRRLTIETDQERLLRAFRLEPAGRGERLRR